jgi:enoyl-[acyl-carrier protein] reductase II
MLGVEIPILQAPMSFIARAQLASAVSNAGGFGIIETGSGEWEALREEIAKMRRLTDRPWGVNIPQLLMRDEVIDFVIDEGVRFVTTSAGDPAKMVPRLKDAGLTVFHVVPTLRGALKAVDAGVDGLVVEGNEGGGFKNPTGASTMVLTPLICSAVDVPVVAAGGIVDGASMAAAFALGAEGVQMGTRMLTSSESPIHDNWKRAVTDAAESDTFLINRYGRPPMRVLRTELTTQVEKLPKAPPLDMEKMKRLYFDGEMEASYAMSGQAAGRIDSVRPVAEILEETWSGCQRVLKDLAARL